MQKTRAEYKNSLNDNNRPEEDTPKPEISTTAEMHPSTAPTPCPTELSAAGKR